MKRYTFIAIESFIADNEEDATRQFAAELSKEHPQYLFELSNTDELDENDLDIIEMEGEEDE